MIHCPLVSICEGFLFVCLFFVFVVVVFVCFVCVFFCCCCCFFVLFCFLCFFWGGRFGGGVDCLLLLFRAVLTFF